MTRSEAVIYGGAHIVFAVSANCYQNQPNLELEGSDDTVNRLEISSKVY